MTKKIKNIYMKITMYIFIIFIVLLLLFFIILCYKKINEPYDNQTITINNKNKISCLYAYYEKDELYKNNFRYFLDNGILDNIDYYIMINGECSIDIPLRDNIIIYKRENKGYDFGAYSYALNKIKNKHLRQYEYYFFINTSVCGPYLRSDSNKKWPDYFIELFNYKNSKASDRKPDIKIVGTSINIYPKNSWHWNKYNLCDMYKKKSPFTHIQSMMFCIKNDYLQYLNSINFFNEEELNNAHDISYIIAHKEFGLSQHALRNGWNINSILSKYRDIDYTKITHDFNKTSRTGDPYFENAYFGETIDKYDSIFFKSYRLNK